MPHVAASLTQSAYRFRNDDGSETTATWKAAENTPVTIDTGETFRVRFVVQETAGGGENNVTFQLQRNLNGGGWVNVDTTSAVVRAVDSAVVANGQTTTDQIGGSGTFQADEVSNDGLSDLVNPNFSGSDHTEAEFTAQIVGADVNDADTIELRVIRSGGGLEAWTQTPTLTVAKAAGGAVSQTAYRVRDDSVGLNVDGGWLADQNVSPTLELEKIHRLRYLVQETVQGQVAQAYKLQYRRDSGGGFGAWTDVELTWPPTGESNRATTGIVEAWPSGQYTSGDPITASLLTGGAGGFANGEGVAGQDITTGSISVTDQYTELEWTLKVHRFYTGPSFVAEGEVFEFRVVASDGTPLDAYTQTPNMTVESPYRIGGTTVETPQRLGPFIDTNGNLYTLVEHSEIDAVAMMMKSVDGGVTWAPQDVAGIPVGEDFESVDTQQVGDTLWMLHHEEPPVLHTFHTSDHPTTPDTWGITDESVGTGDALEQSIAIAVLSDGRVRAFWTGTGDTLEWRTRAAGGGWDTQATLDATTTGHVWAILSPTTPDLVHVFSKPLDAGTIKHWTVNSAGTVTGPTSIATGLGTNATARQAILGVTARDDAGVEKLYLAWQHGDDTLRGRLITDGVAGVVVPITPVAVEVTTTGGRRGPVSSFLTRDGTDLHVFYTDAATEDFWHTVSTDEGATWDTPEEILDGVSTFWAWGHVFTHSVGNGGGKVVGWARDYGPDDGVSVAGDGTGYLVYGEYALSAGPAPVSEITGSLDVAADLGGTASAPTATISQITGSLDVVVDLSGNVSQPASTVDVLSASLDIEADLSGALSAPAATVPPLAGSLDVAVDLDGTLASPPAGVLALTSSLDVEVDLGGAVSAPVATVPSISGSLDVAVGLSGALDAPAATVPQTAGTLAVEATLSGVLADSGAVIVPAVAASLDVEVDFGGTLDAPVATVPQITGSLATEVDLSGAVTDPGVVVVPKLSGTLATEVDLGGAVDAPTATVAAVSSSLNVEVDLSGVVADPGATVGQLAAALPLAVDLGGTLNTPVATVPGITTSFDVEADLGGTVVDPTADIRWWEPDPVDYVKSPVAFTSAPIAYTPKR